MWYGNNSKAIEFEYFLVVEAFHNVIFNQKARQTEHSVFGIAYKPTRPIDSK